MSTALAATALLMGLAGGPHCAVMCGAACAGVARAGRGGPWRSLWAFQGGRLTGYALAGAAVAQAVGTFAWLSQQAAVLRPVFTVLHLGVLAWGLTLLVLARQPEWVALAGRRVWDRVRPQAARGGGVFATGVLWAFMPCGLLYSALLVASLTGDALEGALAMALFALGSGVPLAMAPALLARVHAFGDRFRQGAGTRAAGAVLVLAAAAGLWSETAHRIAAWCGL
ncbi:sulfite exporter TauE/SafE family protein [Caenimonas sedimenti]|uniref:Sulfite exporter TauE/SafE family protein n=2 Tax=Caenimonas sedimenti TaxID=2596921 RepID=A0A562ZWF3_9BURK|nr:sulfite exporter TauE/SafE family protein [Caenimonas sedimenti]